MGNARKRQKERPLEERQEQEPLLVMPQPEQRRKKATQKRAVEEVNEEQSEEVPNVPQPEVRRTRGRPRKKVSVPGPKTKPDDQTQLVLTMPLEDNGTEEVYTDSVPELDSVVDVSQPPEEVNMPINANSNAEKISGRQSDNLSKSGSLDLTKIVEQMCCDWTDHDELGLVVQDEARVSVCGYEVKSEVAHILKLIFSQFGDPAKDCIFPSITSRARRLESVCTIYQRLEALSISDIKSQELNSMLEEVNDLEISKVEVGWLLKRLYDISGARQELEKRRRNLLATKNRRNTLEKYKEELECCKENLKSIQEKICKEEKALAVEEAEGEKISEMFTEGKSALRALCEMPSLAHGLLGST